MRLKNPFLLFILCLVLLNACKKEKIPTPAAMDQELFEYLAYSNGSWWDLKRPSSPLDRDSFFISNYHCGISDKSGLNVVDALYNSKFFKLYSSWLHSGPYLNFHLTQKHKDTTSIEIDGNEFTKEKGFYHSKISSNSIKILDSCICNGNMYKKPMRIIINEGNLTMYFARNIGLIEIIDNRNSYEYPMEFYKAVRN